MKILLVEDDRTIASGLEYSLKQENFETVLCHNAASATEVIIIKSKKSIYAYLT